MLSSLSALFSVRSSVSPSQKREASFAADGLIIAGMLAYYGRYGGGKVE